MSISSGLRPAGRSSGWNGWREGRIGVSTSIALLLAGILAGATAQLSKGKGLIAVDRIAEEHLTARGASAT